MPQQRKPRRATIRQVRCFFSLRNPPSSSRNRHKTCSAIESSTSHTGYRNQSSHRFRQRKRIQNSSLYSFHMQFFMRSAHSVTRSRAPRSSSTGQSSEMHNIIQKKLYPARRQKERNDCTTNKISPRKSTRKIHRVLINKRAFRAIHMRHFSQNWFADCIFFARIGILPSKAHFRIIHKNNREKISYMGDFLICR